MQQYNHTTVDHITDNIYLSDEEDASNRGTLEDHDIVYVISLTEEEHIYTTIHHPIKYGDNPQTEFDQAVEYVRKAMDEDHNVIVHCVAGISRSSTVVTAALAAEQELRFNKALNQVKEGRPIANPHPDLREQAETYLENQH